MAPTHRPGRSVLALAGGVVVGGAAALLTGAALGQRLVDRWIDARPAPGRRVVVDGAEVHVRVHGAALGDAPVVLADTGLGGSGADWDRTAAELGDAVTLVAVDRPGLGWSEPGAPPDVDGAVRRAEAVLDALGVAGPVVLLGWSLGGLLSLAVATERPERVAGLVLVDPSHPDEARLTDDPALRPPVRLAVRAGAAASALGAAAVLGVPGRAYLQRRTTSDGRDRPAELVTFATSRSARAVLDETLAFPAVCDEVGELHARRAVPPVPAVMVRAGRRAASAREMWDRMHAELATWVPGTEVRVAEASRHPVPFDDPAAVAAAVLDVVARLGEPVVDLTSQEGVVVGSGPGSGAG